MRVDELSGDSTVSDVRYDGGVASLRYQDGDSGRGLLLQVSTDCLYSEAASEEGSVHVRLIALPGQLPVDTDSGRYLVPGRFADQMKAVREGLHLAIGRRAAEFPLLLQVRGYRMLLACPIRSVDTVDIQVMDREAEQMDAIEPPIQSQLNG